MSDLNGLNRSRDLNLTQLDRIKAYADVQDTLGTAEQLGKILEILPQSVAPRISELRKLGYVIQKSDEDVYSVFGRPQVQPQGADENGVEADKLFTILCTIHTLIQSYLDDRDVDMAAIMDIIGKGKKSR